MEKDYGMESYNSDLVNKYQKALFKIVAPGYKGEGIFDSVDIRREVINRDV